MPITNHAVEFVLRAMWTRHLQKPMESGKFLGLLRLDMPRFAKEPERLYLDRRVGCCKVPIDIIHGSVIKRAVLSSVVVTATNLCDISVLLACLGSRRNYCS